MQPRLLDARDTVTARTQTVAWLNGTSFDLVSVAVDGNVVDTVVAGADVPPDARALAAQIATALGRPVVVDLRVVRASNVSVPGQPLSN